MIMNMVDEASADIAINARLLIFEGEIKVEDSRVLIADIVQIAEEFVNMPESDWPDEDYMLAIDLYAINRLKNLYGVDQAV